MGRRRSYFISVLFFGAFFLSCFTDSKELFRELTCYRETLALNCGNQSIIAIHQAYFTSQRQENHTCHLTPLIEHEYIEDEDTAKLPTNYSYCYEDVRLSINRRCSGVSSCNFTYSNEVEKQCSNPDGVLIVQYDCVRIEKVIKYCQEVITATEGYIAQPGYPRFIPSLPECSWSLFGVGGQTINVKILHLHLSAPTEVRPTISEHDALKYEMGIGQLTEQIFRCDTDSLSMYEGNLKLFSVCGQSLDGLRNVETDANNSLVLTMKSSGLAPYSGFLAYFKIKGCPDMAAGENMDIVIRNDTTAVYACRYGMVFNDTLESTRSVYCVRNHHWSNTLSSCIQLVEETTFNSLLSNRNSEEKEKRKMNASNESIKSIVGEVAVPPYPTENATSSTISHPGPRFTEDVMIPCIIIAILIVGNSIIIIIVYIMRRNKKDKDEDDEEEDLEEPNNSSKTSP